MLPSRSISSSRLKLGFVATELAILVILLIGLASGSVLVQQSQNPEKKAAIQQLSFPPCRQCNSNNVCISNPEPCMDANECDLSCDCTNTCNPTPQPTDSYTCNGNCIPEGENCWRSGTGSCQSNFFCCTQQDPNPTATGTAPNPTATPTVPQDKKGCSDGNNCWVPESSTCIGYHKTNIGYICCGRGEGRGVDWPHFEPINTTDPVDSCAKAPAVSTVPKDPNECAPGCWIANTSVCIPLHQETGTKFIFECCGPYESGYYPYSHFERVTDLGQSPCVTMAPTPTSPAPTLKPCTEQGASKCIKNNTAAALCYMEVDNSLRWWEYDCTGNYVCGKLVDEDITWNTCISITPSPGTQEQLAPLAQPANKKGNNNILNLFRRFLNFLF